MEQKGKSYKVQNLSFFMALVIVWAHCRLPLWPTDIIPASITLVRPLHYCENSALSIFFFISGYLFFRNYSPADYVGKMKKRLHSLFIPYLAWNTLSAGAWYAIIHCGGAMYVTDQKTFGTPMEIIGKIISCQYSILWYVAVIMVFALAAPMIHFMIRDKRQAFAFLVVACIVATAFHHSYCSPLAALPNYLLGAMAGTHRKDYMFQEQPKGITATAIVVYLALLTVNLYIGDHMTENMLKWTAPAFFMGMYDIIDSKIGVPRLAFTKYSFFLYAAHYIPLHFLHRYLLIQWGAGMAWFVYLGVPVAVVAMVLTVGWLMDKKCHKAYALLTGNR